MKTLLVSFAAVVFMATAPVQAAPATSTLRIACDNAGEGANISVNGVFKGECPIDVTVPAGVVKLLAEKTVNGKANIMEQSLRLGASVVKRIQFDFGLPVATNEPSVAFDPRAVAQARYAAEQVEYEKAITACLPRFQDQMAKWRAEYNEAKREHAAYCRENGHEDLSVCGMFDEESGKLSDRKREAEEQFKYKDDSSAVPWCREQIRPPVRPR